MKGIVFTEFLTLVENKFGLDVADQIIEESNLESNGAYTSVGTYDFSEMLSLLSNLSALSKISVDDLLQIYAEHFFDVLLKSYPHFFKTHNDPIEFLSVVESHIHVEVLKIYPDAELPSFKVLEKTKDKLIMVYTSSRAMYTFGLGLMHKTFKHYNCKANILVEKIKEDGTQVKFSINKI
ncbi:heme NO-binding domain-containing protein [Geojedonia litorea]|uniref:Heme NO-binding domain-containing protein n=1 Tax=Geojedonia litorea TaxID=1268269 RepID=A0ABV9N4L1_9FLAO